MAGDSYLLTVPFPAFSGAPEWGQLASNCPLLATASPAGFG
jgi:hypothetical protein